VVSWWVRQVNDLPAGRFTLPAPPLPPSLSRAGTDSAAIFTHFWPPGDIMKRKRALQVTLMGNKVLIS
jgi:hypothetical protein